MVAAVTDRDQNRSLLGVSGPSPDDVAGHLEICHARIRCFSRLAVELGRVPEASHEVVANSAVALVHYFGRALPLHIEDEDLSIAPRLVRWGSPLFSRPSPRSISASTSWSWC